MSLIDGIDVGVYECDCGNDRFWIFGGQNSEGYKIACPECGKDQRNLIDEMKVPYLWRYKEVK